VGAAAVVGASSHLPARGDRDIEYGNAALDGNRYSVAVPLPRGGAALDVGEEEGDGAGGRIGRGSFQRLGWTRFC
jgi:hypothetical protein